MGHPLRLGRNDVLKFRSVKSMVIAPARTGSDSKRRIAVTSTAHGNKGIRSTNIPITRKLLKVVIKFTAPSNDDTPARWRKRWQNQLTRRRARCFCLGEGRLFSPSPHQIQLRLQTKAGLRLESGIIVLYCLAGETPYLVPLILGALVSCQTRQLEWVLP